jgi:CDP-paratose 2-epimerase
MLEAIAKCEQIAARELNWTYQPSNRIGDHIWYLSDTRAFQLDYPDWSLTYDLDAILAEIFDANRTRWRAGTT